MKFRILVATGLGLALVVLLFGAISAASVTETEPNDTPGTANPLDSQDVLSGAIDPVGDQDYFALDGVNTNWGFIALLDTSGSTQSSDGLLTALRSDGTTILQSDLGSWERGSGIALQNYADGGATHYLQVNEQLNDQGIDSYELRYYQTVVLTQPEVEPNDAVASANPSSFTMAGGIAGEADRDCFSFHGRSGDTILLALKLAPSIGSLANMGLELRDPSGAVLKSVDHSGAAGNEFIEYVGLPSEGAYAYCVVFASGLPGSSANYSAGLVRNGGLYFPSYDFGPTWDNARPGSVAYPGDLLTFTLAMTNTSPVEIPGDIDHAAVFSSDCLSFVSADPPETGCSAGQVQWSGLKSDLAPGEIYSVSLTLRAEKMCAGENLHHDLLIPYFFTGAGDDLNFDILLPTFLPVVRNE